MEVRLFYAGYGGVRSFRIPALIYTAKGTLIAVADARRQEGCDNPNRIDKVIRRSFDRGKTWDEPIFALQMQGIGKSGSAAIDPCVLYDKSMGRIWIFYCYSPAGIGLFNANAGTGYDSMERKLLYDRYDCAYYLENGKIYEQNGKRSGYCVDRNGTIFRGAETYGNIQLSDGIFREFPTCYIQYIFSDDEGESWSAPQDITAQVKMPWMRFIGPGPGNGIVKENALAAGRYVVPVYYSNLYGLLSSAVLYSDDKGMTWKLGASPNDVRCPNGSRLTIDQQYSLQEMQVVEMEDGRLRAFIRNTMPEKVIYYADSSDGGENWSRPEASAFLDNPVCMMSAVALLQGKNQILFSGPWDKRQRRNGTVILSRNGGVTPDSICTVTEGGFGYSSLVQFDEDEIGLLYEVDNGTPVVEEMRYRLLSLQKDFKVLTDQRKG